MEKNIKIGSLVIVKPNEEKEYKKCTYQVMAVERIDNGIAKTSWLDNKNAPFDIKIPTSLLWQIEANY